MVQPLAKSRPAEEIAPVSAFLLETHSKMPDYMRFSIRILTLLFDAWSYPIKGNPFHRLPLSQRIDQVAAWENSKIGRASSGERGCQSVEISAVAVSLKKQQ